MKNDLHRWQRLFLFCLGLFIAGAFAMKWMENDLLFNNEKISIFGLELFYTKEKIVEIFSGINDKVKTKNLKMILFLLASFQLGAWAFDITENYYLLKWLKNPVIGDEFGFYHI